MISAGANETRFFFRDMDVGVITGLFAASGGVGLINFLLEFGISMLTPLRLGEND